jgi:hypothetical protein
MMKEYEYMKEKAPWEIEMSSERCWYSGNITKDNAATDIAEEGLQLLFFEVL